MHVDRVGIAVWLRSTKQVRHLRKYGVVYYVSKSMKYAILYCNRSDVHHLVQELESLSYVDKAERSKKPEIRTEFSKPSKPKENSYDYNVGI